MVTYELTIYQHENHNRITDLYLALRESFPGDKEHFFTEERGGRYWIQYRGSELPVELKAQFACFVAGFNTAYRRYAGRV